MKRHRLETIEEVKVERRRSSMPSISCEDLLEVVSEYPSAIGGEEINGNSIYPMNNANTKGLVQNGQLRRGTVVNDSEKKLKVS